MKDLKLYANSLIDQLIRIKDTHRDVLYADEIKSINNICNLVSHNIQELKRE